MERSAFIRLAPSCEVRFGEATYRITREIDLDSVLGENVATGEIKRLKVADIEAVRPDAGEPAEKQRRASDISEKAWSVAERRWAIIKPLVDRVIIPRAEVEAIAAQASVDPSTIYRWLSDYSHSGHLSALAPTTAGRPPGRTSLSPEVEAVTRIRHAVQICLRCLCDGEPYLRRAWRYSFVLACPSCGARLEDACPHSGEPVVPHRSYQQSLDACHACGLSLGHRDPKDAPIAPAVHDLQTRLLALLASGAGTTVGPRGRDDAFAGVRSLITVARHPDVLPSLRVALGLAEATLTTGRFERMRAADRVVILETVAHWIADWPHRFFVAAGSAGLTQRTFRKVARPGDLARQVMRLPEGFARDRTFVPVLQDRAIKRLRRRNRTGYRRVRAAWLLEATAVRR